MTHPLFFVYKRILFTVEQHIPVSPPAQLTHAITSLWGGMPKCTCLRAWHEAAKE
jgi:hypothetical protein